MILIVPITLIAFSNIFYSIGICQVMGSFLEAEFKNVRFSQYCVVFGIIDFKNENS